MCSFLGGWRKNKRIALCLDRALPWNKSKSIWQVGSFYERERNGYIKRGNIWNILDRLTYINNYMWLKSALQFPTCYFQICGSRCLFIYVGVCCLLTCILFIYLFKSVENRYDFLTDILTSASLSSVTRRIPHLLHRSIYHWSLHFKSFIGRVGEWKDMALEGGGAVYFRGKAKQQGY